MAVFTIKLFCFLSSLSSMLVYTQYDGIPYPPSFYLIDNMGWREKLKMINLSEDLFKQSMLRMRQIIGIRQEHETLISYNIGMLMGRIREKYRFMSETYRDIVDTYNNGSWAFPPGVRVWRPLHYVISLERIRYLELEIDKLVDVMVDEATRDLTSSRLVVGQTDKRPRTVSEQREKEQRDRRLLRSQKDIIREAAEKSFMRERFLMKKLGNPTNMTTAKKRFLQNWPVEDSWSLDKYNHDYK